MRQPVRRKEGRELVTIACPWCDEHQPLDMTDLVELDVTLTCGACGTTVLLVDDPGCSLDLDLAA